MRAAAASRCRQRWALLGLASFALCIWLMNSDRSANAFFMSPPRAWEFLIGGLVATPGFPVLRQALALQIARGIALVLIAIPIFSLRQGPGFPGFNALAPCIGAAMFIWSGIGVPSLKRSATSPLNVVRFFGQISYSLYLWHWPLFTFARFSKSSLVLDGVDKVALFALTVMISYLSWRFVEQPFRQKSLAPTRRAAFGVAGLATVVLLAGSAFGIVLSRTPSDADRAALQLESYNAYNYQPLYRLGNCFAPDNGVFGDSCLALASGKTNLSAVGRQPGRALFPRLAQSHRSASGQHPAGDAGGLHADAQCGGAGQCVLPRLCRRKWTPSFGIASPTSS